MLIQPSYWPIHRTFKLYIMYNKICGKGNSMVLFAYNFNSLAKSTAWIYKSIQICFFQKKQFHMCKYKKPKTQCLIYIQNILQMALPVFYTCSKKHYFIHNQPPVETENEELQKLLKLLPTLFNVYFSASICQLLKKFCLNLTCKISLFFCGTMSLIMLCK